MKHAIAWKVSKYGVFCGPYFLVFEHFSYSVRSSYFRSYQTMPINTFRFRRRWQKVRKVKFGCFDSFDFYFLYALRLGWLSWCSLVVYNLFTHFWTYTLEKISRNDILILISKIIFNLSLFNRFRNIVSINIVLIKISPSQHLPSQS